MQWSPFGGGRERNLRRGERDVVAVLPIQADLEAVRSGLRERQVEDQDGTRLDIRHPGGGFAELDRALPFEEGVGPLIEEADAQHVSTDLGPPPAHPEDQVRARMQGRELRYPDVLEEAEDRKLAVLVDQGVIGEDREVEEQVSSRGWT
jgi:hypothetical protein